MVQADLLLLTDKVIQDTALPYFCIAAEIVFLLLQHLLSYATSIDMVQDGHLSDVGRMPGDHEHILTYI